MNEKNELERGQVASSAAQVYDEFFLPALFLEWPPHILQSARIEDAQSVLDVACGTGVLTLAAAELVGEGGYTAGLDINEGMLGVARGKNDSIDWRLGRAEELPFPDNHFDAVISQFGLMFFEDRRQAVREMERVLKPGGRLAAAVWDSLDHTPGYAAVTAMLKRLFGDSVADALRAPYNLGDKKMLKQVFSGVEMADVSITTYPGTARFPSIDSWMFTDIKGWTLADVLNDDQFNLLVREARHVLAPFVRPDGKVSFDAPAHIVTASKP